MPSKKKHPHHAEVAAPRNPEPLGEAALTDALTKLSAPGLGGNGGAGAAHAQSAAASAGAAPPQAQPPEIGPKTVAAVLGEIIWLMTQSPRHKMLPLADLEWLVMPPVLLEAVPHLLLGRPPGRRRAVGAGRRRGRQAPACGREAPGAGGMEMRDAPPHRRDRRAVRRRGGDAQGD